MNRGRVPGL